jgi:hypothetical protein
LIGGHLFAERHSTDDPRWEPNVTDPGWWLIIINLT